MVYTLFVRRFGMWTRYYDYISLINAEAMAAFLIGQSSYNGTSIVPHPVGTTAPMPVH